MTPQQQWNREHPERVVAATRAWQARNRPHLRAYARAHRKTWTAEQRERNLAKQRARTFKRRYGLTESDYTVMLASQDGHCAICPRAPSQERYGRLNVDHVHETGAIRGLLCTPCNHALGVLGDNQEGLAKALAYVSERS